MFTWRPRPPTLLSVEKQKEIKKNVKKYAAEFDARDKMLQYKASKVNYIDLGYLCKSSMQRYHFAILAGSC